MTHFSLLVNNKPFYATNESQLRRRIRDLNTTPFLERTTPLNIKALSQKSDLYHTGLISELSSKALKEKFWNREELQKLAAYQKLLESGKNEVAEIGEVRSFSGFGELEDGEDPMMSLESLGLSADQVHSIDGKTISHEKKTTNQEGLETLAHLHKEFNSDDSLGIDIEAVDINSDKEFQELLKQQSGEEFEEEYYESEQEELDLSDIAPVNMKVNLVANKCNVELEVAPSSIMRKHGFKEKVGWGSIDESLVSCLLHKTNLIQKYKQKVIYN